MQIQRIQKCDHVLADKNRGEREKGGGDQDYSQWKEWMLSRNKYANLCSRTRKHHIMI